MFTRKDYLDGKVSHSEYYSQFVDDNVKLVVLSYIPKNKIMESIDPNFNDIPLSHWDAMHGIIGPYCYNSLTKAGDVNACSLGNSVCIAKEAARQIKEGK